MSAKLDKATIERNVRRWRHLKAKAAVRVEARYHLSIGEEPSLNEQEVELRAAHLEAARFRNEVRV